MVYTVALRAVAVNEPRPDDSLQGCGTGLPASDVTPRAPVGLPAWFAGVSQEM